MPADLDLAELRRLAEAGVKSPRLSTAEQATWGLTLALLDRLEAAEARVAELEAGLEQVGWGGCPDPTVCDEDGHAWLLRPLTDRHDLDRDHPVWPVYRRRSEAFPVSPVGSEGRSHIAQPGRCAAPDTYRDPDGTEHWCNRRVYHAADEHRCRCKTAWPVIAAEPTGEQP